LCAGRHGFKGEEGTKAFRRAPGEQFHLPTPGRDFPARVRFHAGRFDAGQKSGQRSTGLRPPPNRVTVKHIIDSGVGQAGAGSYVDAFGTTTMNGFINEVDASSTASLSLPPAAPKITAPPISQIITAGTDASFYVGASGSPPPAFQWKHNGKTIANGGEFSGAATPTLTINNVQAKDAGTYTVNVSNSKGSTSASATLTVEPAPTFINLYSFTNGIDGAEPVAGLVLSGNSVYGTAFVGGRSHDGTLFGVSTNGGGFATLYAFTNGNDGAHPIAGFILSGNTLYGTAKGAGSSSNGTVFAINTDGTGFAILHSFSASETNSDGLGTNSDGAYPSAGLILSGGTLYGATEFGGSQAFGTVFAVNTDGTGFTNLHNFTNRSDGAEPYGGLILLGNTLYGTASYGGSSGNGTVFAVNTDGSDFAPLYAFSALDAATETTNGDGASPSGPLILSGNTLYGTADFGGAAGNGTVFAVNTDGTGFAILHTFSATETNSDGLSFNGDGAYPNGGLILSGNTLYGTAQNGGSSGNGTVFAVNTDGTGFTTLYDFSGGSDGALPAYGLILSGDTLYGTAMEGGSAGWGTVFGLGLQPASTPQGSLQVTIAPSGAVNAGAGWQVDNGPTNASGATIANLSVGNHLVSFTSVSGWTTPASQTVAINNGATTTASGVYKISPPNSAVLALQINGSGTIQHTAWPTELVIGKTYTVTAAPKSGNLFSNWAGGTSPPYSVLSASLGGGRARSSRLPLPDGLKTNSAQMKRTELKRCWRPVRVGDARTLWNGK